MEVPAMGRAATRPKGRSSGNHDRGDGAGGNAVVMIMGVWPVGDVMPDPKPHRPPLAQQPPCRPKPAYHKIRTDKPGNPGAEPCGSYEESRRSWKYGTWAWRDKSEMPPSAPSPMIPGRSQSPRLGDPRDHGSGAAGTTTSP